MSSIEDLLKLRDSDLPMYSLRNHVTPAKVVRIIDGDTVILVCFDKNSEEIIKVNARMQGIDTPEMHSTPELARKARNFLISLITDVKVDLENMNTSKELQSVVDQNTKIIVARFTGEDKYGRNLVELYDDVTDVSVFKRSINYMMIASKWARSYDGGTKTKL